ncbi:MULTISPECIES: DUF4232 domain-containing protein [Actinosynnema]|uniref:DUF4232 domain-containing protein n=1 Tax=Actinosynnema TaxID=40566 RepID=UPI0020A27200|nr:DUF4232 domain-containing protein [Actinosynnema pretiosum]MCP2095855.1 Protein of unknown function (DUF4232) [Actinosynnema pretiosum]
MSRTTTALVATAAILAAGGAAGASASAGASPEPVAAAASVPTCRAAGLDIAFGEVQGTAGTTYREIALVNRGLRPCALRGFPGVSYVDQQGDQVGPAAERVGGPGEVLVLPRGGTATADVGFVRVGNFDPEVCHPVPVWGVRVFPPDGTEPLYLPLDGEHGCADARVGSHLTVASVRS